jgi:hypothetical protein
VVGHRSNATPVQLIENVRNYNVVNMINNQEKNKILNRLYRILHFLEVQVVENEVYLFSRRIDQQTGKRQLYLYKVARQDKQQLTFISQRMCDHLSAHPQTRRQTPKNDDDDDGMDLSEEDSNYEDEADIEEFVLSEMDRLNEKKKRNISLRRAENQRKRTK